MSTARVLLVDDDWAFLRQATTTLEPFADVQIVTRGTDLLGRINRCMPDVVLLDLLLDDEDSFALLDKLIEGHMGHRLAILCTTAGRGEGTDMLPRADWPVGTISRTAHPAQLRMAVLEAVSVLRDAEGTSVERPGELVDRGKGELIHPR